MNLKELVNEVREILEDGCLTIWVYKKGRSWNWVYCENEKNDDYQLLYEEQQDELIEKLKKETGDEFGLRLNGYEDLANYTKSGLYNEISYRYEAYKEAELKENGIDYKSKHFENKRGTKRTFKTMAKLKDENGKWNFHIITSAENETKLDFIWNLRGNGFKVDTKKVKRVAVYDFIVNETNCEEYLWEIMYTEKDIENYKKNDCDFMIRKMNKSTKKRSENYHKKFGWKYTYKNRGFSLGCQPSNGFMSCETSVSHKFEVLYYNRKLSNEEINEFELIDLNIV